MSETATTVPGFIAARRSIRSFTSESVPRAALDALVEAACCAPAPHHSRPWRFVTIHSDGGCHGNPGTISVKRNTAVMLDNRDKVAHTIKANGQTFRIAGYDYALIYPATVTKDNIDLTLSNVTCDGGGAAFLNVEK